jgi:GTPase SAR1 family protein
LAPHYFREASYILLVFSVNEPKSYSDISRWYNIAKSNTFEDCYYILIGNKIDSEKKFKFIL